MSPADAPPVPSHAQISRYLTDEIRDGRLVEGQKLPTEHTLAAQFGVSRVVVREAIKVMQAVGLVESRRGSGSYVRRDAAAAISRTLTLSVLPDPHTVASLLEFREILTVEVARLAALRRSEAHLTRLHTWAEASAHAARAGDVEGFRAAREQFYGAMGAASGNEYLANVLAAVRQIRDEVGQAVLGQPGDLEAAAAQHWPIVDAIARQSPDDAAAAARAGMPARQLRRALGIGAAGADEEATHE